MARGLTGLVGRSLNQLRTDIWSHLEHAIGTMETEVMGAANAVMQVANEGRAQIEDSRRVLTAVEPGQQGGIQSALQAQATMLRAHVADMQERARGEDEQAHEAATQVAAISALARQIAKLAGEAQLLSLNARIESGRLARESPAFAVISIEMKRLAVEVAGANERVVAIAASLGSVLPRLAQSAAQQRAAVELFGEKVTERIHDVDRQVTTLQSQVAEILEHGDGVLATVEQRSQEALSHLQFQDVIAQRLRRIDSRLHEGQLEVIALVDGPESSAVRDKTSSDQDAADEVEIMPCRYSELGGEKLAETSDIQAGEVALF